MLTLPLEFTAVLYIQKRNITIVHIQEVFVMKKFLSLVLTGIMLITVLAGCSNTSEQHKAGSDTDIGFDTEMSCLRRTYDDEFKV